MAVTQGQPKKWWQTDWTPDKDLPGPLKVSSWWGYLKAGLNVIDKIPGIKPSDKQFKDQSWGERAAAPFKFAARVLLKSAAATVITAGGVAVAGGLGGALQTLRGIEETIRGGIYYMPSMSEETREKMRYKKSGRKPNPIRGLANLALGLFKLGVTAAIGFTGGGAPAIAALGPAASALGTIPYVGGPISAGLTTGLAHAAPIITAAHSALATGLTTGSTFVAGNVAAHGLLTGAVAGAAVIVPPLASVATGAAVDKYNKGRPNTPSGSTVKNTATPTQTRGSSNALSMKMGKVTEQTQQQQAQLVGETSRAYNISTQPASNDRTLTPDGPVSPSQSISDSDVMKINLRIGQYGTTFSADKGVPKFTGKDPISALVECGSPNLKQKPYILTIPENNTTTDPTITANKLLENAKGITISKVVIGDQSFKVENTNGKLTLGASLSETPGASPTSTPPRDSTRDRSNR